jgi:DNA-binding LacI/PurR family transcriptional regulator
MNSPKSRSHEIHRILRQRILTMPSGALFPAETHLAAEFSVCRATISKVLKSLGDEGLLFSQQGKGRTVMHRGTARAPTIAVLLDNLEALSHPVMAARMKGISDAVAESDFHLSLFAKNPNLGTDELLKGLFDFLKEAQGVIIGTHAFEERIVFELASRYPTVWLEHPSDRSKIHGVFSDYLGAGFLGARHLLENGHSRIAVVGLDDSISISRQHAAGASLALQMLADTEDRVEISRWIVGQEFGGFTAEAGYETVLRNWSSGASRPTGLLFASDDLAIGGYQALSSLGLKVPEDVSLVGCNGDRRVIGDGRRLTTVALDFEASGRACVNIIKEIIEKGRIQEIDSTSQPARLVKGNSVGSPALTTHLVTV